MRPFGAMEVLQLGQGLKFSFVVYIPEEGHCNHCYKSAFQNQRLVYQEFCEYCCNCKYFDENSEQPVCPTCGFKIRQDEGNYNPIAMFKDARASAINGDYYGVWYVVMVII